MHPDVIRSYQTNVLANKTEGLTLILRLHIVKEENKPLQVINSDWISRRGGRGRERKRLNSLKMLIFC